MALYFTKTPYQFNFSRNPVMFEIGTTTTVTESVQLGFAVLVKNLLTGVYEEIYRGKQRFDSNSLSQLDVANICDGELEFYIARPYDLNITADQFVIWKKQCRDFKLQVWETQDEEDTLTTGTSFKVVKGGTDKQHAYDPARVQFEWFDPSNGYPVMQSRIVASACRDQELLFANFLVLEDMADYKIGARVFLNNGTTVTGYIDASTAYPTLAAGDVVSVFYPISSITNLAVETLQLFLTDGVPTMVSRQQEFKINNRSYVQGKTLVYIDSYGGTGVVHLPFNQIKQAEIARDKFARLPDAVPAHDGLLLAGETFQHNQEEEISYSIDTGTVENVYELNALRDFLMSNQRFELWADVGLEYLRYLPVVVNSKKQTLTQNRDRLPIPLMVEISHAVKNSNYAMSYSDALAAPFADYYPEVPAPVADFFYLLINYTTGTDFEMNQDATVLFTDYGDGTTEDLTTNLVKAYSTSGYKKLSFGHRLMHPLTEIVISGHPVHKIFGKLPPDLVTLSIFATAGELAALPEVPDTLVNLLLPSQKITGVTNWHVPNSIDALDLNDNLLTVADVNYLLTTIDAIGSSGGTIDLSGQTPSAAPTGAGATAVTNLTGRGWSVTTD